MNFAPNIFMAGIGDRAIVLDLARNRYIGLNARLTEAVVQLTRKDGQDRATSRFADAEIHLVKQGILTDQPAAQDRRKAAPVIDTIWPSKGARESAHVPVPLAYSALKALIDVRYSLKARNFDATIAWLSAEKRKGRRSRRRHTEQDLVDAFFNARPWFPLRPICRLDAPAICLLFWRNGYDADLVFGARLDPFAAHCWGQHGSFGLNEPHDRLNQYTQIIAV